MIFPGFHHLKIGGILSMKFTDLKIDPRILKALEEIKFHEPTEIQLKAMPPALEGKDMIGQAMTGSGKTAAFGIPIAQRVAAGKGLQALVLEPTRELAEQVTRELVKFSKYCGLRVAPVYGGVDIVPQINALRSAEVVVATPGRILDHMQRGTIRLSGVHVLVLDEGDRMLDMGFIDDIRRILSQIPASRQTMLFSATMPDEILNLSRRYLRSPVRIDTPHHISKHLLKHAYYDVKQDEKLSVLVHLIQKENPSLAIVFCAMRYVTDIVAEALQSAGIEAKAIHGAMTQSARMHVLDGFHRGKPHILVATDVAARGLDIQNVSHIFNYDVPKTVDDYTHRVGRTARLGKTGRAITLLSSQDHPTFRKIVQYIEMEKGRIEGFKPFRMQVQRRRDYGSDQSRGRRYPRRY